MNYFMTKYIRIDFEAREGNENALGLEKHNHNHHRHQKLIGGGGESLRRFFVRSNTKSMTEYARICSTLPPGPSAHPA